MKNKLLIAALSSILPLSASALDIYKDDNVTVNVGGRLHLDLLLPLNDTDDDDYDVDVRRARLQLGGKFFGDWESELQLDFANSISKESDANNRVDVKNAYIAYTGFNLASVKVGQFKAPMSLEELTSSNNITMLERAPVVTALSPSYKSGVALTHDRDTYTLSGGLFGESFQEKTDRDEWGPVVRATFHPSGSLFHAGASLSQRWNNQDESKFTYGIELASVLGPVHGQFEYMGADYESDITDDSSLNGYYVQLGWFITGESRPYEKGVFKGVKPNNSYGAWELVGRYGSFESDSQYEFGANWYANQYIRFGINYVNNDTDENLVQTRVQLAF